jgi:hypothetical protein
MRQVDSILERFPGPVTLVVSRRRRVLGLVVVLAFAALFVWGCIASVGPRTPTPPQWLMLVLAIVFFGGLAIRGVILLFMPAAARLTLDGDGFEVGRVFEPLRISWHAVSEFRVEKVGAGRGKIDQIRFDVFDGHGRRTRKRARVLGEFYGEPRLGREELVLLMNAWRARALATTAGAAAHAARAVRS